MPIPSFSKFAKSLELVLNFKSAEERVVIAQVIAEDVKISDGMHQRRPRPRASFLSPAGSPRLCCLTNFRASATHSAHLVRAHCSIHFKKHCRLVGRSVAQRMSESGCFSGAQFVVVASGVCGRGLISGELLSAPPLHLAQPFKDFRAPRYLRCFADFIFTVAKQGRKEEDTSFCQEDYALFLH